jgi:hypothetical protein
MSLLGGVVLGILLVTVAPGCGADEETQEPQSRPLSDDEAARLAQTGYTNFQAGGAEFEANSAFLVDPIESLTLYGEVDWVDHLGRAVVRGSGPDEGLIEVYWDLQYVYERRPAMDIVVEASGGPPSPWIARPADPSGRQLDRLIALVMALASEQPDNALLIQQTDGSAFMRTDELRDSPVEVLRYGNRNLHWLSLDDGRLVRFEGNSSTGTAPTVIDLVELRIVEVPSLPPSAIVPIQSVAEWYERFVGR